MSTSLDSTRLFVRVDASAEIGIGHFMRCFALAQYWRDQQREVTFIGQYPKALVDRLRAEHIEHIVIPSPHPVPEDLAQTLAAIPSSVPVVLDGYRFDAAYQQKLSESGRRLLVIDDTGHLPAYAGDLLVNQNSVGETITYQQAPATRLIGTQYVLLGRDFRQRAVRNRVQPPVARKVLVTLGGADPENVTLRVVDALRGSLWDAARVLIVAGPANARRQALADAFRADAGRIDLAPEDATMPELMDWANLAIAAAGTTCWELAFMEIPSILLATVGNQEGIGEDLQRRAAAVYIGHRDRFDWDLLGPLAAELAADQPRRQSISATARRLVDGEGVARVTSALTTTGAEREPELQQEAAG